MKARYALPYILILITACCVPLLGADVLTERYGSSVNWTKGHILATGKASIEVEERGAPVDYDDGTEIAINRARSDASARAREDAFEGIIASLKHIRLDSRQDFAGLLSSDETMQGRLSGLLGSRLVLKEYPADFYSVRCEARLSMGDLIASLPFEFPQHEFPLIDDTPLASDYSGLIIDARGLGIEPMVFPSVLNEDGLEIYGRIYIDGRYASRHGMAAYCYTEDEAKAHRRAGRRPFYTVALKNMNGSPVISDRDAKKILASRASRNNLKKCRLIIILDRSGVGRQAKASR